MKHKKYIRFMKKITELISSGRGSVYFYGVFLIMGLLILLSVFFEYFRIYGTVSRVEKAYEKAMLSVAITNYDEIFTSMRESGQLGGVFEGGNETDIGSVELPEWVEMNDMGDVSQELASLLDIQELEEKLHAFDSTGNWLYSVDDISMSIHQSPGYNEELKYEIEGEFHIEIPVYFIGNQVSVFSMKLPSRAVWKSKL